MEIFSSTDVKREFGEMLMKSQRAPISVTRNGKPVAVLLSEIEYQELKLLALRAALVEGEQGGNAGLLDMPALKAKAKQQTGLTA